MTDGIIQSGFRSDDGESLHVLRPVLTSGRLSAAEFLALAAISENHGDGTLRLTSRQGIQITGIKESAVSAAQEALQAAGFTTANALGNSLRNITVPVGEPALEELASEISEKFQNLDPLPQKLKIGLSTAAANSTDVLVNDIAIISLAEGFLLMLGGGAGGLPEDEHGARIALAVCEMTAEQILPVIEAVLATFVREAAVQDSSRRRLKHIVANKGADWFRQEISAATGFDFSPVATLPTFGQASVLGWQEQDDGNLRLGFPMLAGRFVDVAERQMMSGFKALASDFGLMMILTTDQNIVLPDIAPANQDKINQHLRKFGCWTAEQLTPISAAEITCPGAPACRLGVAAAESIRHKMVFELEGIMDEFYVRDAPVSLRIAGCARGCSRPYTGEIGIVGGADDSYAIYLGGLANGTVLGTRRADGISADDLPHILEPIFELYSEDCETGEPFGEFIRRSDDAAISELIEDAIMSRKVAWAL